MARKSNTIENTGQTNPLLQATRLDASVHRKQELSGTGHFLFCLHPLLIWSYITLYSHLGARKEVYRNIDKEFYRMFKPLSETSRQRNTRDNLMTRVKHRKVSNRNQNYLASSELPYPKKANIGYPNKLKKQDVDSKSIFMMLIEDIE